VNLTTDALAKITHTVSGITVWEKKITTNERGLVITGKLKEDVPTYTEAGEVRGFQTVFTPCGWRIDGKHRLKPGLSLDTSPLQ